MGVPEEEATTWLAQAVNVRWQTAQAWLLGTTIPLGKNLHRLAKALGIAEAKLLGPMVDEDPPPAFDAFRRTPEGASMTDVETWTIRLFSWAKEPTVGEYRQLLALYRANSER